jgi:hypothetical protein
VGLGRRIQYFTFDVISTMGFGQAFGDVRADADLSDYINFGEEGLTIVTRYLQWAPLARLLGPSVKDKPGFGKILATARDMIDSRMGKSVDGRSDMLALLCGTVCQGTKCLQRRCCKYQQGLILQRRRFRP